MEKSEDCLSKRSERVSQRHYFLRKRRHPKDKVGGGLSFGSFSLPTKENEQKNFVLI